MAKLRINGDSSGYVDLSAPNAASSSTIDLDQVPQKNVANTFSADMSFGDNNKVNLGAGNDLQLYHDGYNNYIKSAASGWLNVPLSGNGITVADSNFSNIFFKIDSSGRVVTPKQPSFTVKKTTAQTGLDAGSGAIINWDVALHNIGGHYNLSTNRFTAPVAGRYQFSAGGNIFHYSGTGTYYWRVVKNGGSGQYYAYTQRTDAGNVWIQLILQNVIIDLDANDYIDLFLHASNSASKLDHSATNHWSFYSGHLIG
jgi:hypothetical protein